jgi:glyoxylase-like metal-dependent hydrolase (beta-lactamase superfamily II)
VQEPWGRTPVPDLYVRELKASQQLRVIRDGDTVIPGMVALDAPGHTPGHMISSCRA